MSFDVPTAIRCAEAIAAMYRGDLEPTIDEPLTDTQVRIEMPHAGEAFIIFPGTASMKDWRTDARIVKTNWAEAGNRVHRGFAEAYRSVGAQIKDWLANYPVERVTIAGHSLGGALATLCADAVMELGFDLAGVYTFGSPRVGNRTFARRYNEDLADVTFRVVNARDPVPWVPLPLWSPRTGIYTHIDSLVYLPALGGIEVDAALMFHPFDVFATLTEQGLARHFFSEVLTAREHAITAYLDKLKAA